MKSTNKAGAFEGALISNRSERDRAFRLGDGLFESVRCERHGTSWILLNEAAHFDRLIRGADVLGLTFLPTESEFREQIFGELRKLKPTAAHAKARFYLWRGGGGRYTPETNVAEWAADAAPLKMSLAESVAYGIKDPIRLIQYDGYYVPRKSETSRFKTMSALPYVMAARFADNFQETDPDYMKRPFIKKPHERDALIMTTNFGSEGGCVSETTRSNIFVVGEGRLLTPELGSGCVEGTMRNRIFDAARGFGYDPHETKVHMMRIYGACAIFTTNAIDGVRRVGLVSGFIHEHSKNGWGWWDDGKGKEGKEFYKALLGYFNRPQLSE